MTGLNHRCFESIICDLNIGHGLDKFFNVNGIDTTVTPLVYYLENIIRLNQGEGDLDSTGTPTAGNRHFA